MTPKTLRGINYCLGQLAAKYEICYKNHEDNMVREIMQEINELVSLRDKMEKEPDSGNCTGPRNEITNHPYYKGWEGGLQDVRL